MEEIGKIISIALKKGCGYEFSDDKEKRPGLIEKAKKGIKKDKEIKELGKKTLAICKKFPLHKR